MQIEVVVYDFFSSAKMEGRLDIILWEEQVSEPCEMAEWRRISLSSLGEVIM